MSISKKMREWYVSIEDKKFVGIAEAIMDTLPEPNPKYNQQIDSLLARLTHAYIKYSESHKNDISTGLEIYKLTCCLCDRFSKFSNPPRLRSGIYHITRCLRDSQLYAESITICNYVKPGKIFSPDSNDTDYFYKLSIAWRQSAELLIKSLSDKFNKETYSTLLNIIKFDFELIQFSENDGNYFQAVLARFQRYMEKITASGMNWGQNNIEDLFYSIIEHIKMLESKSSQKIDSNSVYDKIIGIIHCLNVKLINSSQIFRVSDLMKKLFKEFESFLGQDPQIQECFALQISFYKTLVQPVTNFDKIMFEEIRNYRKQFHKKLNTYGPSTPMMANANDIYKVLTFLFNYWVKCMQCCSIVFINEIFFEVANLAQYVSSILGNQVISNCKCGLKTCKAKANLYDEINTLQKCCSFVCMFDPKSLTKDLLIFTGDLVIKNTAKIDKYKSWDCGLYSTLWNACGQIIYNLALVASVNHLIESAEMFSNLCSFIISEEGVKSTNNFLHCKNPLSLALYKLSGVYFKAEKYREAMIVSAFNGLISYEDKESKAFRMWSNIKHKCNSEVMIRQSMIACLKADKAAIKEIGVEIKLDDYDLAKLCVREIQRLQQAKVNLTPAIKASLEELCLLPNHTLEFIEGVQYLGYHVMYFRDDSSIKDYLRRAEAYLCNCDRKSIYYSCLMANLELFKFFERFNAVSKKIKKEMKNTKNILLKGKDETKIHDQTIETEEVVPVYRMINMKHDAEIVSQLEQVLLNYENCFQINSEEFINCWEPQLTLDMIIITGEFSRLFLSQSCEIRAWVLAYKLASILRDHSSCLYVTARSISLRYINDLWIEECSIYAEDSKNSDEYDNKSAVGMFWTSLADFYFEKGKHEEALKLMEKVNIMETIGFKTDVIVYLDFIDTIVRNYKFYSKDMQHEEYSEYMVYHLYAMISVNEVLNLGGRRTYYGLNTLFECVNHMSHVLHCFISFREISAHLTLRLELAQSLGATLRVAECLKSLCFIDLSRLKLNDCEVKLQGLEQILDVEGFGLSMKNKCPTSIFRSNIVLSPRHMDVDDPLRDVIQNEASPILRKKIFVPPEFMLHDNCSCYRCENIPYQYLVFSSTHIRAQIYALKNYSSVALQHFHGAFEVRRKLLEKEESRIVKKSQDSMKLHSWQKYYSMVDYVSFLLDFSKFIMEYKIPRVMEAVEVALEAINICKVYNLETHPVYFATEELVFQYRFQNIRNSIHGCTVPDIADIDISDVLLAETSYSENQNVNFCVTPSNLGELPLRAIRRKKTPPLLPLTKVSMSLSDSEDSQSSKISRRKPPRKRILDLDRDSASDEAIAMKPTSKAKPASTKNTRTSKTLMDRNQLLEEKFKKMSIQPKSIEPLSSDLEDLVSKVQNLKLENFQKTPMFTFSDEDLSTMQVVLNEKEFQDVIQSIEELKLFNFMSANNLKVSNSIRPTRSKSKVQSFSVQDKTMQTFNKNMNKVLETLTNAISRRKCTKEKSPVKNVECGTSALKVCLDISRPTSPDLFSSEDESFKICDENNSKSKFRKSKTQILSQEDVGNSDKGKRNTRSRSVKLSGDNELNPKKVSRIPRKQI